MAEPKKLGDLLNNLETDSQHQQENMTSLNEPNKPCSICGEPMQIVEDEYRFVWRCKKSACCEEKKRRCCEKKAEDDFPPMYRGAKITDCVYPENILGWINNPLPGLLTFYGGTGNGKTRLMYAIIAHLRRQGKEIELWQVPALLKHLQVLCGTDSAEEDAEVKRLCRIEDTLCLDDLGAEKVTEFTLQDFYMILAEREQWQLPTLITTNLTPKQISTLLSERIASRIAGGMLIHFTGEDRRLTRKSPPSASAAESRLDPDVVSLRAHDKEGAGISETTVAGSSSPLPPEILADTEEMKNWEPPAPADDTLPF